MKFSIDPFPSVWTRKMQVLDEQMTAFSPVRALVKQPQRLFFCPLLDEKLFAELSKMDRLDVVDRGVSSSNGLATTERYVVDASVVSNLKPEISMF